MAKIREVLGDKPVRPGLRRSMSSQELVAYQRSVRPAAPIGDPEPNLAGAEVN